MACDEVADATWLSVVICPAPDMVPGSFVSCLIAVGASSWLLAWLPGIIRDEGFVVAEA